MTDIKAILQEAGVEGEQADGIAKAVLENYRTIAEVEQKAAKIQSLTDENAQLTQQLESVKELDGTNAQALEDAKARIAEYEQQAEARKKAEDEKQRAAAFDEEFAKGTEGKAFAGPIVRDAVKSKTRALRDANPDMSFEDALKQAVGDGQGVWANPQRDPHKMPQAQQGGGVDEVQSLEQVSNMSAEEINQHWGAISKLLAQQK